jgi:hypothetical protein
MGVVEAPRCRRGIMIAVETVGFCIKHCLFWWVVFVGCFGERLGANVLWDQKYSSNNAK